jgi:hypothetical protein
MDALPRRRVTGARFRLASFRRFGARTYAIVLWATATAPAADDAFDGLNLNLGNLCLTSKAQSRSISAENPTGEKGKGGMATQGYGREAARELGQSWKVSPAVIIPAHSTFTVADINGCGAIQQIRLALRSITKSRLNILRFYWDDEADPSVEVPLGDFFACGWGEYCPINSLPVCVNPASSFCSYWLMPFRKHAKMTVENLDDHEMKLTFQVNYTLTEVPKNAAYFHAQFRRESPLKTKGLYTILDGVRGEGQYVGTYLAWESRSPGWWGEGEIKFFIDGDKDWPTICGTGTEDYFGGSYDFVDRAKKKYQTFSTSYAGLAQVLPPDKLYEAGQRFGLYRWHITDPVRFQKDFRVTIQALGWKPDRQNGRRYLQLEDDIASVAYWYQIEPHAKFPPLPGKEALRVKPLSPGAKESEKK